MPRHLSSSFVLSVALWASPVFAASDVGAASPIMETDPPEDMIDFLGRRKECSDLAPEPEKILPQPAPGSWREWLGCENLAAEESALRRRYESDGRAIAFLNQAPSDFRLDNIIVHTYDGPPPARVERSEQRGLDAGGRIAWRMVLDRGAAEGRATAITVSWANYPSRTIYLDNGMLPWLDLTSAWVAIRERPHEALSLELRYGFMRGWCGDVDRDDRSRVSIYFRPESIDVSRQDRTDCNSNYRALEPGAFTAPPPAPRR